MDVYLNVEFFKAVRSPAFRARMSARRREEAQAPPSTAPSRLGQESKELGVPVTAGYGVMKEHNADSPQTAATHARIFGDATLKDVHDAFSQQAQNGYYTRVHRIHLSHGFMRGDRAPKDTGDRGGAKAYIHGDTYHPQHGKVGSGFTRRIEFEPSGDKVVEHTSFYIDKQHQRNGVSKAMFRGVVPFYRKIGAKRIKIDTLDTQGRYTWARTGFHWGDAGTRRVRATLPTFLKRYGLSEDAARKLTLQTSNKPWDVAGIHVPLTEHHRYVGRTGEEGHHQYHYEDQSGNRTLGTNAPVGHPEHDPAKGAPHLHVGHAYLTDDIFGNHVWQDGGTLELQDGHPTYERAKHYLGLKD
jgi:GNAT superfamily N-acetyltransferase